MVLDLDVGTYYGMNEVGARIWALIEEPVPISSVVSQIMEEFDVEHDRCEASVLRFLERLAGEDLIRVMEVEGDEQVAERRPEEEAL